MTLAFSKTFNLIQEIYYIYYEYRLGYQWWHQPFQIAKTV